MISTWRLAFGLVLALGPLGLLVSGQKDLELDYSDEYDNVRPMLVYPDEPRLEHRLTAAAQEFGESIRDAWQSIADSFKNYFEELRIAFADGIDDNVEPLPVNT
ncbi:uncharacterized protein LOC116804501 [Drosophila mojavensis]|uniref:Uncharacterized protein LOC108618160 n=1 Tax=Drosophila arizonae TaxID=7263 RepID=A0ABM1PQR7_DROAR|nr:PREDICTED: uncharacterized protein LOC108618160 [Drosophila arizonae]XP_032588259.1 uncharacterized protein LOC116804501 [Drosophila mojavensis]